MRNKYLHTLIAIAVLAALWGAFTYFGRSKKNKRAESASHSEEKLVPVSSGQITSFTIQPHDGTAFTCVRQGHTWQITAPRKLVADNSAVDNYLSSLTGATVDEVVEEHPADLKDFGLDPPQESIQISANATPSKLTLLVGTSTPTNQGLYAQVAGQPRVIMMAGYLKDALDKKLFDLRDKRVVTLPSDQINLLSIVSKKGTYTLVKNPEGVWDLELPPPVRADHFAVEGLVDELGTANMQSIVADTKKDLGKYGFPKPTLTVQLRGTGGAQTLVVGSKQGDKYYAMNSAIDSVFTVGADFLTQFEKKPSDLRSKDLFTFPTFEASKITVDSPKGHEVFEQSNDKWSQSDPVSKVEPSDKVESLLDALRNLSAQSFPQKNPTNLASYGLAKPAYSFQVEYGKDHKSQTVQIAEVDGHVYARRSTDLVPAELSKDALQAVAKALNAL